MSKPGTIKLPVKIYPQLLDKYTEEEKKHMLVLTAMDINKGGLQIFQTVPELMDAGEVITAKEIAMLAFPIVKNAINGEYVHAKLICLLNNTTGAEKEQQDYMLSLVFIADKDNKNFKLADIFFGEPEHGAWAKEEDVEVFAKSLTVPVYKQEQA